MSCEDANDPGQLTMPMQPKSRVQTALTVSQSEIKRTVVALESGHTDICIDDNQRRNRHDESSECGIGGESDCQISTDEIRFFVWVRAASAKRLSM